MGQKLKIWATMTSLILLSGILGFGFSADAQVPPEDPPVGNPSQAQNGCDKSDPRSGGNASRNPQCDQVETFTDCDTDGEFGIDAAEIADQDPTKDEADGAAVIVTSEDLAGDSNDNGVIDTAGELILLNSLIDPDCV